MNKRNLLIVLGVVIIGAVAVWVYYHFRDTAPALTATQEQNLDSALVRLDERLQQNPKDTFAYLDKASYLRQLGREDEALAVLEQAYTIDANWRNVGDFKIEEARIWSQKDTDEGIRRYEAIIQGQPASETLFGEYIAFLKRAGQPREKIISVYDQAIRGFPDSRLKVEYDYYLRDNPPQ
jgi:tetratricopeptide (TPR) repeat protein